MCIRDRGILLLLLPDIPFRDIAERVMTRLVEERQIARRRAGSIAKELGRRLADGEGVTALCEVIGREAQTRAAVILRDGRSFGSAPSDAQQRALLWEPAFANTIPRDSILEYSLNDGRRVVLGPVAYHPASPSRDDVSAVLVLDTEMEALDESFDALYWLSLIHI